MRVLVTGSRDWSMPGFIYAALRDPKITTVIHGAATGADAIAGDVALLLGVPVIEAYPAWWDFLPRAVAGPERNQRMLDQGHPDVVYAFPLPGSRGTWDMVRRAKAAGCPVQIRGAVA